MLVSVNRFTKLCVRHMCQHAVAASTRLTSASCNLFSFRTLKRAYPAAVSNSNNMMSAGQALAVPRAARLPAAQVRSRAQLRRRLQSNETKTGDYKTYRVESMTKKPIARQARTAQVQACNNTKIGPLHVHVPHA